MRQGVSLPDGRRARFRNLDGAALEAGSATPAAACPFALCYRPSQVVRAQILDGQRRREELLSEALMSVVDENRLEGVNLTSAPLASSASQFSFAQGQLTRMNITDASTALAAAKLPTEAIAAFFGAIGNVLTVRVQNATRESDLLAQQNRLLELTRANIEARAALERAQQGQSGR